MIPQTHRNSYFACLVRKKSYSLNSRTAVREKKEREPLSLQISLTVVRGRENRNMKTWREGKRDGKKRFIYSSDLEFSLFFVER